MTTGTRPYLRADSRRRQLLDAAARVFARAGYAGLTMVAVASEAGVSRRLVYDHFADQPSLLAAYFDDASSRYVARLDQAVASGEGDLPRAFAAAFAELLALPREDARAVSLLVTDTTTPDLEALRDRFRTHVERRWLPGRGSGVAPEVARPLLWVVVAGLFQLVEQVHRGITAVEDATAVAHALVDQLPTIAAHAAAQ